MRDCNCVYWNSKPGGTEMLRPILLTSEKETSEMLLRINKKHIAEIENLHSYTFTLQDKTVTVHFVVEPAMRDGKENRILTCDILQQKAKQGIFLKNWPTKKSVIIDNVTCPVCLQKRELYSKSVNFDPILFDFLKKYGFCPLHKKVRGMEWMWKGAEKRVQYLTGRTLTSIKEDWQAQFQQSVTHQVYFKPDPLNRGNSNNGTSADKFFEKPDLTSSIIELPSETIAIVGVLLQMINSIKFQSPRIYKALAIVAHQLVVRDITPYYELTGLMHSLLCHGNLYIEHAQNHLGVPLGALTESSIEGANKTNKQYKNLFSRKNGIKKENNDIFVRRLIVSDPVLAIDEEPRQVIRKGNIRKRTKK